MKMKEQIRRERRKRLTGLAAIGALALTCVAVAGCGSSGESSEGSSSAASASFPGGDAVPAKPAPPLKLTDYRGHVVDLASLKGKPVLVAFLYTHCHDLCPLVAAKIHTMYSELEPGGARPVFLAVTVDPAHDTPASAAKFNREHRTTGEIDWLLGTPAELKKVWKAWDVIPKRERNDPEVIEHSADLYGVGADGNIHVLYSPEFKPPLLAKDVQELASQ